MRVLPTHSQRRSARAALGAGESSGGSSFVPRALALGAGLQLEMGSQRGGAPTLPGTGSRGHRESEGVCALGALAVEVGKDP